MEAGRRRDRAERVVQRELMMVAAHTGDLQAAASHGLRTAFVARPGEWGPGTPAETPPAGVDVAATSFVDLASQLGA
jgi:2-haloacid dehalogenase